MIRTCLIFLSFPVMIGCCTCQHLNESKVTCTRMWTPHWHVHFLRPHPVTGCACMCINKGSYFSLCWHLHRQSWWPVSPAWCPCPHVGSLFPPVSRQPGWFQSLPFLLAPSCPGPLHPHPVTHRHGDPDFRGPEGVMRWSSHQFRCSHVYRVILVLPILVSLLRLLLTLQFDLHGVADQGSEDGVGLRSLDEQMLKDGGQEDQKLQKGTTEDAGLVYPIDGLDGSVPPSFATSCYL